MSPATVLVVSATAGVGSMLETTITASMSFLVFTFGSLLVAIQLAGGKYTSRVIATIFLRDKVVRSCVGIGSQNAAHPLFPAQAGRILPGFRHQL